MAILAVVMSENSVATPPAGPSLPQGFSLPHSDAPDVPSVKEGSDPQVAVDDPLPTIALIAAGLTAFDSIVAVAITALWSFQRATAFEILPAIAGPLLLFGIAPIIVGGMIQNKVRKEDVEIAGAHWGRWAIIAGVILSTITLLIPLSVALAALSGASV